jgi:hypothetical protein
VTAWDTTADEHSSIPDISPEASYERPQPCELEYKIHAYLTCEPYTALRAPVTEIVVWNLKENATSEKVKELLTALMKVVNNIPRSEGMHKAGWGSVLDNERQYVVIIGWDSMEVCPQICGTH